MPTLFDYINLNNFILPNGKDMLNPGSVVMYDNGALYMKHKSETWYLFDVDGFCALGNLDIIVKERGAVALLLRNGGDLSETADPNHECDVCNEAHVELGFHYQTPGRKDEDDILQADGVYICRRWEAPKALTTHIEGGPL